MKHVLAALVVLVAALMPKTTFAVPADPSPSDETQGDGTVVTIYGRGDEYFHWMEDEYGYVVAHDGENWTYADVVGGEIVPTDRMVYDTPPKARGMLLTAEDLAPLMQVDVPAHPETPVGGAPLSLDTDGTSYASVPPSSNFHPTLLVMVIEYNDAPLIETLGYWSDRFFDTTVGANSANQYYNEVSNGQFSFQPMKFRNPNLTMMSGVMVEFGRGTAHIKLYKDHPGNDAIDDDIRMAFEIIRSNIDFTVFKDRHNDYIKNQELMVSVLVAGWEKSANVHQSRSVWAHMKSRAFSSGSDSVVVSVGPSSDMQLWSYTVQGEVYRADELNATAEVMGIGAMVHELGHALGLPDLYDRNGNGQGLGMYSLMAGGSWGHSATSTQSGTVPVHLDAWCKVRMGFVTPMIASYNANSQYTLNSIQPNTPNTPSASNAYTVLKVVSNANPNQYFLVENRQQIGYDAGLYAAARSGSTLYSGVMIYHISDGVVDGYAGNDYARHKAVDVEEANGIPTLDDRNAPFPYDVNHFFSLDGHWLFDSATAPNSNFHIANANPHALAADCHPQIAASHVRIATVSPSSPSMVVEVGTPPGVTIMGRITSANARYGATVSVKIGNATVASANIPAGNGVQAFALHNVPRGAYTLEVSKAQCLSYRRSIAVNDSINLAYSDDDSISTIHLYSGDLDNDGDVDEDDCALLTTHYNATASAQDLNGDGVVNGLDYALLMDNYGKTAATLP